MQRIASRQNSIVAKYKNVAAGDDEALMLLDGVHLVGEALSAKVPLAHLLVASEAADRSDIRPLVEAAVRAGVNVAAASAPVMRAASPVRSSSPIVALAGRPQPGEAKLYGRKPALVLIACGVQDPGRRPAAAAWSPPTAAPIRLAGKRSADRWAAPSGCQSSSIAASSTPSRAPAITAAGLSRWRRARDSRSIASI
jgi:hypothetical protein